MKIRLVKNNQGYAIVVLVIILLMATAIGMFGLRSSQSSLKRIGVDRSVTELKYESERGLQKAVTRIQVIAEGGTDAILDQNDSDSGTTGGDFVAKTLNWLVTTIPTETAAGGSANPDCDGWDPNVNFDQRDSNVVCNFLGVNEEDIHVALVRKDDLVVSGTPTQTFAIFLVNAIAYDGEGRRQISQGVVVVPYDPAGPTLVDTPYLSNSKNVVD